MLIFVTFFVSILFLTPYVLRLSKYQLSNKKILETASVTDINEILYPDSPLLTIFTTFKDHSNNSHHGFAHRVVIDNWATFDKYIKPVLFVDVSHDTELSNIAKSRNWDILPLNRVNPSGAPFLKDMYFSVFDKYNSTFYGFANGDILFNNNLLSTLTEIKRNLHLLQNNVLIIGIRTNVDLENFEEKTRLEFAKENLENISDKKGTLFIAMSEDYFFFTKHGCTLNWTALADVVIGRVAYDNYIVAKAKEENVHVIDATRTLLAVHLSKKGVTTGRQNIDNDFNNKAIGPFNYGEGTTTSVPYETRFDLKRDIVLLRR